MIVDVGVIGVGSMGRHHARVYSNLQEANLVGVSDVDRAAAEEVAEKYGTDIYDRPELIERVDAISVTVPTEHHFEIARECIEADVDVLVEKPFVKDIDAGRALVDLAEDRGVQIHVGHVERFNPAVRALDDILPDLEVIAYEARRLGPDVKRGIQDTVVMDLMIHDLDVITSLAGGQPTDIQAKGTRDGKHASAILSFENGTMASLLTSRVTQEKIRELRVTAKECFVKVDYLNSEVEIHRNSVPEFVTEGGDVKYRHESVIERPVVDNTEPLLNELSLFLDAIQEDKRPVVSGRDGLRAVQLARDVEDLAFREDDS